MKKQTFRKARSSATSRGKKRSKANKNNNVLAVGGRENTESRPQRRTSYTDEYVVGKVSINSKGFGFVTPEGMMKNQADEVFYREGCQFVINNSNSFKETIKQIDNLLKK